jgi:tight adherence protein B
MIALFAMLGALSGAGLVLVGSGIGLFRLAASDSRDPGPARRVGRAARIGRPGPTAADVAERRRRGQRLGLALAAGVGAFLLTHWAVAFFMAGLAVLGSEGLAPDPSRRVVERLEAVATWTEMLRDTLAGASGLTQAIISTAGVAPRTIRTEVGDLAARMSAGVGVVGALTAFSDSLCDPASDTACAALAMAATERSQRLGELLGGLAAAMREEVALRRDIEASRASARTAVRTITGFSVGFVVMMAVFARGYLMPYRSLAGQLVLGLVACIFGLGLWLMAAMVRPRTYARLRLEVGAP